MLTLIGLAGSFVFKLFGGHLFGGGVSVLEQAAVGLGFRFCLGVGFAFYLTNDTFKQGIDQALGAILKAVF